MPGHWGTKQREADHNGHPDVWSEISELHRRVMKLESNQDDLRESMNKLLGGLLLLRWIIPSSIALVAVIVTAATAILQLL